MVMSESVSVSPAQERRLVVGQVWGAHSLNHIAVQLEMNEEGWNVWGLNLRSIYPECNFAPCILTLRTWNVKRVVLKVWHRPLVKWTSLCCARLHLIWNISHALCAQYYPSHTVDIPELRTLQVNKPQKLSRQFWTTDLLLINFFQWWILLC